MLTFYHNIIFTQRQISTTLAGIYDLSLLWKLRKVPLQDFFVRDRLQCYLKLDLYIYKSLHWCAPLNFIRIFINTE